MEKSKLVDKLMENTGISYEEAKEALEANGWDILEAMLYLEQRGRIKKPAQGIFYTNDYQEDYYGDRQANITKVEEKRNSSRGKNDFNGFFEAACRVIDVCNNIFLAIKRNDRVFLKLPLTVLIVLLLFGFWIILPLMIIGLFFDIEYFATSKGIYEDKIEEANKVFRRSAEIVQDIKNKFKAQG